MVTDKKVFHIEVAVSDQLKVKRRLIFTAGSSYNYTKDNIIRQPLHARIPCDMIKEGVWLNLQLDIYNFIENCFGGISFRSIDSIMISGACRLRKVMTMKNQIVDNTSIWLEREFGEEASQQFEEQFGGIDYNAEELPGSVNFTSGVEYMNQVVSFDRITFFGYLQEQLKYNQGSNDGSSSKKKPQIAFGTRITAKTIIDEKQKLQNNMESPSKDNNSYSPQRYVQGAVNEGILYQESRSQNIGQQARSMSKGASNNNRIMVQDSQYNSNKRTQSPQIFQGKEQESQIDFSQYKGTQMIRRDLSDDIVTQDHQQQNTLRILKVKNSQQEIQKYVGKSPQRKPQQIDDHYLNERIKYLNKQRQLVHQIAQKYGIVHIPKIQELSLISTPGKNGRNNSRSGSRGEIQIHASDPKDRIKEYHEQVNSKRREIHKKAMAKRKILQEQEALNPSASKAKGKKKGQEQNNAETQNDQDQQDQQTEEQETKRKAQRKAQNEMKEGENVEGWDGENEQEYGAEGAEEKNDYGEEGEQLDMEAEGAAEEEGEYGQEEQVNQEDYGQEEAEAEAGQDEVADADYGAEGDEY